MDCNLPGFSVHGILQARILLQGIFPTQESHPGLLHCRQNLFCLNHHESPVWTIQSKEFSRAEYWSGYPVLSPGDLPNPRIKPRSPALQAYSLPAEPQGKSKNTGVGILSLLQGIFPTQESNQGLLHCRRILYQLSFERSPNFRYTALQFYNTHTYTHTHTHSFRFSSLVNYYKILGIVPCTI